MFRRIKGLLQDEEGAAMVEYALLVALIAVVCTLALTNLGTAISDKFDKVANDVASAGQ